MREGARQPWVPHSSISSESSSRGRGAWTAQRPHQRAVRQLWAAPVQRLTHPCPLPAAAPPQPRALPGQASMPMLPMRGLQAGWAHVLAGPRCWAA